MWYWKLGNDQCQPWQSADNHRLLNSSSPGVQDVVIFPKRSKFCEVPSWWTEELQSTMQSKAGHGELTGQLAQEKVSITFQRQQNEIAQPSHLGFFTCSWGFPLLAGWPRIASYIATSVSSSPVHFLPTVLSRQTEFTKSLPLPASVETEIHIWRAENVMLSI